MNTPPTDSDINPDMNPDMNAAPDAEIDRRLSALGASWRQQLDAPPPTGPLLAQLHRTTTPSWYRRPIALGVAAAVVVIALVVGTFLITGRSDRSDNSAVANSTTSAPKASPTSPTGTVQLPNLVGLPQAQAIAQLRRQGLKVGKIITVASPDADKGKVVKQSPADGTGAAAAIDLSVGGGVAKMTVPNVVGQTQADAQAAMQQQNLKVKFSAEKSDDSQRGKVLSQSPAGSTSVVPGSTVNLVIGSGLNYTKVPTGLKGKSYDDAAKLLQAAHLAPGKVTTASVDPKDQVEGIANSGQTIKEGDTVPWGTQVNLTVSDNTLMKMPTITGGNIDTALAALQQAQWSGKSKDNIAQTQQDVTDQSQIGQVLKQDPAPGKVISKQNAVSVTVGQAKQYTVPGLISLSPDAAQAACVKATVQCQFINAGMAPKDQPQLGNTVTDQSIPGGSQVPFYQNVVQAHYLTPYIPPTTPKTSQ